MLATIKDVEGCGVRRCMFARRASDAERNGQNAAARAGVAKDFKNPGDAAAEPRWISLMKREGV